MPLLPLSRLRSFFAAGLLALSLGLAPSAAQAAGEVAPDFNLRNLNPASSLVDVSLASLKGNVVLLNFWATWCGPCIKEMPELDELDRAREDVIVLGLAFEDTTPDDLRKFLGQHAVSYPIAAVDVYAPPAAFSVPKGLPTTHLIAPDGSLRESFIGPVTRADLEKMIDAKAAD